MELEEIMEVLSASDRWGVNDQPSIGRAASVLSEIPLSYVVVEADDTVRVFLKRPMTQRECFIFIRGLSFDAPEKVSDIQTEFKLWWD